MEKKKYQLPQKQRDTRKNSIMLKQWMTRKTSRDNEIQIRKIVRPTAKEKEHNDTIIEMWSCMTRKNGSILE